jgi:hypothetical protein
MQEWYKNNYRRHLCDMHIDDWDESFLSDFSPEAYFKNLKTANITAPMIYFQAHTGYCYYPTATGYVHKAFQKDPGKMRRLVEHCHQSGMAVIGYYSLDFNTWAHDTHPQWRMLQKNGKSMRENEHSRYGLCCPNNPDYRNFVFTQIKEMLEYFSVEGMFYDMLFWPHVCWCPDCQRRWADEVGGGMPTAIEGEPWEHLLAVRRRWMGEWAQTVTDFTKALRPEITVEHNFASAISHGAEASIGDGVSDACDYTGGDLYGGFPEQSFTCKYYRSVSCNQPFEYMTCRCDPNLQKHTITKPEHQVELAVMLTCAHHGATLMIDAIDPVGTMDARVYETLGRVFAKEIPYEDYFRGNLLADVGVMYHLPSKAARRQQSFTHHHAALQASKTLTSHHIPYGVVTYKNIHNLSGYQVILAPLVHSLSADERNALIAYVRNGGNLYLSGAEDTELVYALLGADVAGFTEHTVTYLAPTIAKEALFEGFNIAYPLPFDLCVPVLQNLAPDAQILAYVKLPYTTQNNERFASIHSNPPGLMTSIPAVAYRELGKGRVLFSAMPIEKESVGVYGKIFMNLLHFLKLTPGLSSTAPAPVELVTFDDHASRMVGTVNLDPCSVVAPFSISMAWKRHPQQIRRVSSGEVIPYALDNGILRFQTVTLDIFDLYVITR